MTQQWDYKNRSVIPLIEGVNPLADPIEYMRMINSPRNAFELTVARNDAKSDLSKKETTLLQEAEELRIIILLKHICEYAEVLRQKEVEKATLLQDWRQRQAAEEDLHRHFAKPSDPGSLKYFDKSILSAIADVAKLTTKFYEVTINLQQSQQRIQVLNHEIQQLAKEAVIINQDWRTAKADELEQKIAELQKHDYKLAVLVRDENGKAVKQVDEHGKVKKDKNGRDMYVFRSVSPDSEEGRKVLDAFHVLPSTASDLKDDNQPKPEYAISRRLQALLLSYDIAMPLAPLEKAPKEEAKAAAQVAKAEAAANNEEVIRPIPLPPKPPKKPPQGTVEKVTIDFDQFFKREQLEEAFQILFIKTRGGISKEELTTISSEEMLALLREEFAKNGKFKIKLQHKPSPATLNALTAALKNALEQNERRADLANEEKKMSEHMKEAAAYANEFLNRGLGPIDVMKMINGTDQEKAQILERILAARNEAEQANQNTIRRPNDMG